MNEAVTPERCLVRKRCTTRIAFVWSLSSVRQQVTVQCVIPGECGRTVGAFVRPRTGVCQLVRTEGLLGCEFAFAHGTLVLFFARVCLLVPRE